jgi:hypothetical protein
MGSGLLSSLFYQVLLFLATVFWVLIHIGICWKIWQVCWRPTSLTFDWGMFIPEKKFKFHPSKWIRITSIINLRHGSIDFCLHSSYQICVQKFPSCCKNAPESFSLLTPRKKKPSLQSSILTTGTSLLLYVPYRLLVISFGSTTWEFIMLVILIHFVCYCWYNSHM